MTTTKIGERDLKMLELLSLGESSKEIARRLGYRPGTTRVYMHVLYKKLGVANRSAAAAWYFNHFKIPQATPGPETATDGAIEETVGDMALRTGLLTALGAMSMLLGAYGKLWHVATRLKGVRIDAAALERRRKSRALWEALLRGDFAYGKALHDIGGVASLVVEAPSDAAQAAVLLLLGGHSNAADQVIEGLAGQKRAALSGSEYELLAMLRGAVDSRKPEALKSLHAIASGSSADPARHIAMAALFHLYVAHGDRERAGPMADALWMEAEACRQHLLAMGEKTFQRTAKAGKSPAGRRERVPLKRRSAASRGA